MAAAGAMRGEREEAVVKEKFEAKAGDEGAGIGAGEFAQVGGEQFVEQGARLHRQLRLEKIACDRACCGQGFVGCAKRGEGVEESTIGEGEEFPLLQFFVDPFGYAKG